MADSKFDTSKKYLDAIYCVDKIHQNLLSQNVKNPWADLLDNVNQQRNTDVNIFNIGLGTAIDDMIKIVNESRISAIFCTDSDFENVLV